MSDAILWALGMTALMLAPIIIATMVVVGVAEGWEYGLLALGGWAALFLVAGLLVWWGAWLIERLG
jgi:hypothetical protein